MDSLHTEQLLYYQSHSSCALELYETPYWRVTAPDTHQSFFDTTLCAYTASLYTSLFGAQLRNTTKLTHLITAYYTPMMASLPTTYHFITVKLANYTTHYSVFSINHAH